MSSRGLGVCAHAHHLEVIDTASQLETMQPPQAEAPHGRDEVTQALGSASRPSFSQSLGVATLARHLEVHGTASQSEITQPSQAAAPQVLGEVTQARHSFARHVSNGSWSCTTRAAHKRSFGHSFAAETM